VDKVSRRTVIGDEWKALRSHIITQRGRVCEHCLEKVPLPSPLLLHHIDKNASHNETFNLVLLCVGCHDLVHDYRKD